MLSAKATKLFIFSMLVILVAGFGAFINFQLIALPMSELVPAGSRVLGLQVSDVSALVIVTLEIVLGIFLMEALGITGIFPQVAGMTISKRRILLYASLTGLFSLPPWRLRWPSCVNISLNQCRHHASVGRKGRGSSQWRQLSDHCYRAGHLGFVLPWILAMVLFRWKC